MSLEKARELRDKLVKIVESGKWEGENLERLNKSIGNLTLCINRVELPGGSERHLKVILPKEIEKAKAFLEELGG